jgi:glyoxylase-like metal-dependent hydrolase (beta-lactamase superfamily II)
MEMRNAGYVPGSRRLFTSSSCTHAVRNDDGFSATFQSGSPPGCGARVLASFTADRHAFLNMREILPGIFTWGSTYADRLWDLNGYAIALTGGTVLIDPPAPEEADWQKLPTPITTVVLTNRDHVRDAVLFRTRYGAHVVAGQDEIPQFTSLPIDETVQEGDLIGSALRVIDLPGKSPGEIGLYLEPAYHAASRDKGGILILGDAIIGNPPGALGLIPEDKLDDPKMLRGSLPKILDYQFEVLLLCDGQPVLHGAKRKVSEFLSRLS